MPWSGPWRSAPTVTPSSSAWRATPEVGTSARTSPSAYPCGIHPVSGPRPSAPTAIPFDPAASTARLRDAAASLPPGPPLRHQPRLFAAASRPQGETAFAGSFDGEERVWPMARRADDPGPVATRVEALTGLTLNASGPSQSLDRDAWLVLREAVRRQGDHR